MAGPAVPAPVYPPGGGIDQLIAAGDQLLSEYSTA
jgi:hypothetical protein